MEIDTWRYGNLNVFLKNMESEKHFNALLNIIENVSLFNSILLISKIQKYNIITKISENTLTIYFAFIATRGERSQGELAQG